MINAQQATLKLAAMSLALILVFTAAGPLWVMRSSVSS